jgi:hypothetical protein
MSIPKALTGRGFDDQLTAYAEITLTVQACSPNPDRRLDRPPAYRCGLLPILDAHGTG